MKLKDALNIPGIYVVVSPLYVFVFETDVAGSQQQLKPFTLIADGELSKEGWSKNAADLDVLGPFARP